jgi:hypothetical protein
MTTEMYVSILGAGTAIAVSVVGALLANRNSIVLQTRKLKEEHYVAYFEALHNLAENEKDVVKNYVFSRDKLFLIASEDVIKRMIKYEEEGIGKGSAIHDAYLTELIKSIRKDLKIKDKDFPKVYLKKSTKD